MWLVLCLSLASCSLKGKVEQPTAEQAGTPKPSTAPHPHDEVQAFQPLPILQLITKTISLGTGPVLSCLCALLLSAEALVNSAHRSIDYLAR